MQNRSVARSLGAATFVLVAASAVGAGAARAMAQSAPSQASPPPDLASQTLAIFTAHCAECHGPSVARPKGRFGTVLDLPQLVKDGHVTPGNADDSELFKLLVTSDAEFIMPPAKAKGGPLTAAQIDTIRAWIAAGATAPLPAPTGATTPGTSPPESTPGTPPPVSSRSTTDRVLAFGGKFHPVVVHFPIALLMTGTLAECLAMLGWRGGRDAARLCVPLGAIAAIVATVLGLLSASYEGYATPTIGGHRLLGIIASVLGLAAAIAMPAPHQIKASAGRMLAYRGLLLIAAALTGLAGHQGGEIVHGPDHFAF